MNQGQLRAGVRQFVVKVRSLKGLGLTSQKDEKWKEVEKSSFKRYSLCSRVYLCVFAQIIATRVFVLGRRKAPKRSRSNDGTLLPSGFRRTFTRLYFSRVLSSTRVKCLITCTVTVRISDGMSDKSNPRPRKPIGGGRCSSARGVFRWRVSLAGTSGTATSL